MNCNRVQRRPRARRPGRCARTDETHTFLMPHGDDPVSHNLPSGLRVRLERASGWHPLRLVGRRPAADIVDWGRAVDISAASLPICSDPLLCSATLDQGPWVGMEACRRGDDLKTNQSKRIIWEIPERKMRWPPSYGYRGARCLIDNDEWFPRISALLK